MLRPKEVVCRWVDAFNGHDVEAIAGLYHDGAVNHQVANEPVEGIEAIREMFAAEFAAANMTAIVENIFEDGQWAILEWRDPLGLRGCGRLSTGRSCSKEGIGISFPFLNSTTCRLNKDKRDREPGFPDLSPPRAGERDQAVPG